MSHHHDHCCCGEGSCNCCNCECHASSGHHHEHDHEDFAHQLLEMADEAWMEVLKEKIKEQIKTHNGAKMDKLAELVASANNERWKFKLSKKHLCQDFHNKLHQFFSQQ